MTKPFFYKGQVEPLTAVMITGLIVASVGTVYVWGTPLLEKRGAETEIVGVENNLIELQNKIHDVEASGQGATERITLNMPDDAEITADSTTDTIRVETSTEESIYAEDSTFSLTGSNVTREGEYNGQLNYGLEGVDDPSMLQVQTISSSDSSATVIYEIKLNNLFGTTFFGEALIVRNLQTTSEADTTSSIGETDMVITNGGETIEEEAGEAEGSIVDVQEQTIEITLD